MIKLLKDKKEGWYLEWQDNWDGASYISTRQLSVTAQEVLDLLNQIKEQQKELLKEI